MQLRRLARAGDDQQCEGTDVCVRDEHQDRAQHLSAIKIDDATDSRGPSTRWQPGPNRAPERWDQPGLLCPASAGVAENDEQQNGDADSDHPRHCLDGHRERSGSEHEQRAESGQWPKVAG